MNSLTEQGIAALKAGDIKQANQLLQEALEQDSDDLQAWLWLSGAVETDQERIFCLENVLRIQPDHPLANAGMAKLSGKSSAPASVGQAVPAPGNPDRMNKIIKQSGALHLPSTPEYTPPILPSAPDVEAAPPAAEPEILPEDPYRKPPKKPAPRWLWLVAIMLLCCVGSSIVIVYQYYTNVRPQVLAQAHSIQLTITKVMAPTITSTPTIVPSITSTGTITPTPTIRPTNTPSPTPSFVPAGPTVAALMGGIQKEVSDLRGLPIKAQVPSFVIVKDRAETLLIDDLITADNKTALQNEKQVLVAFGLIKPDYNLVNNVINRVINGTDGFFIPWDKQIFIVGIQFGGYEEFAYAHEFDHALVDQNFDMVKLGITKDCIFEDERCQATQALIEGDAMLLQSQWLKQYAGPRNLNYLNNYNPPLQILPDKNPPPYVMQDLDFPYQYGQAFTSYLYDKGSWAQVNLAYQTLPKTTEQIIHPEKYVSGEGPILVNDFSLDKTLGSDWKLIQSNSFGEWTTYLLLGYGLDVASQVESKTAKVAAAGWGGDRYQVLYNTTSSKTALAAHWIWDTPEDAVEFQNAMQTHLGKLYRGNQLDRPKGQCWQVNNQTTCLYAIEGQTLWLQGPDTQTMDTMLAEFPAFNQ